MGKGARSRRKRQEADPAPREPQSVDTLTLDLFRIGSPKAFRRLIQRRPELLSAQMLDHCDRIARGDGFGELFASIGLLLREAAADPAAAWANYEVRRNAAAEQGRKASSLMREIDQGLAARKFDSVVCLADEAIPLASAAGLGLMVGELENHRGQALFQSAAPGRADRIERAIISLNRAVALSADADRRAGALMHLGLAMGERVEGDRADNLDAAVNSLTTAVDTLGESSPPWLWAIVRTNLAWALLRRERGDRVEDLRRAESLCEEAYRSPERDADDWAHTQLNLGEVRARLFELGQTTLEQVERTI
jgi:hypothetical protein